MFISQCMLVSCSIGNLPEGTRTPPQNSPTPVALTYQNDCRLSPSISLQQLSYKDIEPGRTTGEQAKKILGTDPLGIDNLSGEWIFPDNSPHLLVEDEIVTKITVSSWPGEGQTVQELLAQYGCPDFVFTFNQDDNIHTQGGLIVFLNYGVAFSLESNPITLASEEVIAIYFRKGSQSEFERLFPSVTQLYQPLDWEDVIQSTK